MKCVVVESALEARNRALHEPDTKFVPWGGAVFSFAFDEIYVERWPRTGREEAWLNQNIYTRAQPDATILVG